MRSLLLAAALALLAACAGLNLADIRPGTPRDAVIARAGRPTRVVAIPGGERLQYSLQPVGREAWMVDLDAVGRVVRVEQVLTQTNLERIQPGWTREDVEREFGPPAQIDRVSSWKGPIMNYRWRDRTNVDMWYWVYLDDAGVVRSAHPGIEYPMLGGDGARN